MKNVSFTIDELLECNVTRDMETFTYFRTPGSVIKEYYRIKNFRFNSTAPVSYIYSRIKVFGEVELRVLKTARELEPCVI